MLQVFPAAWPQRPWAPGGAVIVIAGPSSLGNIQVPPESGINPSLQKAWMNLADRAAITISAASARLAPAPAATPFTAQTTGMSRLRNRRINGL